MQLDLNKDELEILYVMFDAKPENNLQMGSLDDKHHMYCKTEGLFVIDEDYFEEFRRHLFELGQRITEAYEEVNKCS